MQPDAALSKDDQRDCVSPCVGERHGDGIYRLIVELVPHAIVLADPQGRIVMVNPGAEKLFGYAREELIGHPVRMLVPERFRTAHFGDLMARASDGGAQPPARAHGGYALRKDGTEVPAEIALKPIETPGGGLLLSAIADSAGRGLAQEKTEWLATFPERNPNPIFEFDLARGTVHYVNPSAARIFPDLQSEGLRHPLLAGLPEAAVGLVSGEIGAVRREVMAGACFLAQTITYDSDEQRLRVYSSDITARRMAEMALRESEELFATSFRLSPDYVVISRLADRTVIRANDALCELWGCTPDEVIGKPGPEFVKWISEDERSAFIRTLQDRGECLNYETSLRMTNGRLLDFNISSRMITFGGEPCVLSVLRDITERKRVEVAAARLAAIVESSDDAIVGKDLSGIITSWNAGAEKNFGYSAQEIVGQPITRLIPPDRLHEEVEILDRIRRGESVRNFDTVRLRKDGSVIPVSVTVSAIKDPTGKIIGASKVARDITDQKKLELERRESEASFRGLFEQAAVGIAHVTLDGVFARVNRRFAEIVGMSPDELQACTFQEITHPDDLEADMAHVHRLLAGESQTYSMEKRYLHRDGGIVWIHLTASLVRDEAGAPQHFVSVVEDITERKRMAAALRASEERLRLITDLVPHGIFAKDAAGRYIFANRALAESYGFPIAEILGKTDFDLVSEKAQAEAYRADDLAVIQSGVPKFIPEEPNTNLAGHTRFLQTTKIPFTEAETGERAVMGVWVDITARKEAEEAFKRSEASFRTMADSMAQLAWIARANGFIFWYNRRWYEYTGTTPEQMEGWGWQSVHDPAVLPSVMEKWTAAIASGEPFAMESPLRGADGQFRTFLTRGQPFKDAEGRVTQWFGTNTDVDELKQVEESLRESEQKLQRILDTMFVFVGLMNLDGTIVEVNQAPLDAAGLKREDVLGKTVPESYWFSYSPAVQTQVGHALARAAQGEVVRDDYLIRVAGGGHITIDTTFAPLRDASGRVSQIVGSAVDITERKLAEAAVRESEGHFRFLDDLGEATRTLADPAQIMAVMARMLGEHLRASRCAYADVEQDGEQFTILHDYTDGCTSTVGNYQLSLFGTRAVATLNSGQTLIIRDVGTELLPADGADMFEAIGIHAIITCPLVKNGRLRAMMAVHQTTPRDWQPGEILIVQDVVERCWATIERRTAEEKIHQLNATLEQRVTERTAQLEAANKELEAFSYSVSHDLRAPLRAVDGFSQAVLEDYGAQLPEDGRRHLQTIREGAQKMGMLIDDLLTFSRLGRAPLKKQAVNTTQLVRSVLEDLDAHREARRLEVRVGELPESFCDPALLRQVWFNLLSNAFKYTQKRDLAVVEVGCEPKPDGNVYSVRDNGTGFDMRYAGKLFGVFQRLHRAEEYEGTGVGLAIVQRVIHRHGGSIWANAAVDRGATFYFTLGEGTES